MGRRDALCREAEEALSACWCVHLQATIELLSEFDAELAASVRGVANLRTKEYKQQLAAEGYPADFTRRSYMRYQIKKLLVTDVDWQFEALSQVRWPCH